ncbi:UrcA family protein [Phenylobacterium sp.]|uniref:UrcA family protein n=1 Tax=Phenylobacterium sp. TaxID=1871053 RepID=UPI0025CE0336|nr:UrcA family protein [Phenylobacterium sp.]
MKTFAAFASVAALLCTAPLAQAQAITEDTPTVRVGYGDLDLSRAGGRAVLEQRIRQAIDRVCPRRPMPSELSNFKAYRTCLAETWTGVQPQLAQIYNGRQLADSAVRVMAAAR